MNPFVLLCYNLVTILLWFHLFMPLQARERAVAVVAMLEGPILHWKEAAWQPIREQLRIHDKNTLEASKGSRVLLQFRDGSWLRLFENSRLSLESETSPKGTAGYFERKWILHRGSLLANLVPGRQLLLLQTPSHFQVLIRDGVLSILQQKEETSISISSGSAQVRNARSFVVMKQGQWLDRVDPGDLLGEKIKDLPNILRLEVLPQITKESEGQPNFLTLRIQLSRRLLKRDIRLGGPVLLSGYASSYPKPRKLMLDARGRAEVNIPLATKWLEDPVFDSWIRLMVSMDSGRYPQVAAGFGEFQVVNSKP